MLTYLKQGALVIGLALAFGAALAAVQVQLQPMIDANQKQETLGAIPGLLACKDNPLSDRAIIEPDPEHMQVHIKIPQKDGTAKLVRTQIVEKIDVPGKPKIILFKVMNVTPSVQSMLDKGQTKLGELPGMYVIRAEGMGFGDKIVALVGYTPQHDCITGVYVLDQKETPGLGDKICSDWVLQYKGMSCAKELKVLTGVKKKPAKGDAVTSASMLGTIDAISGATISSRSLTKIVNKAVADIRASLAAIKKKEANHAK